ncbi:MAG: diguanylate cyclase [Sulfurimonas sp.]
MTIEITAMQYYVAALIVMLLVSVYYNLKQRSIIQERDAGELSLIKKAYYNPVTQLPNLTNVKMMIDDQMNRTTRHDRSFLLAVIKIKNYHEVSLHSQELAEEFILEAADRVTDSLRAEDVVAHTTENGFVILFNEYLEPDYYNVLVERLNNAFSSRVQLNSTTSFGYEISIGTVTSSDKYPTSDLLINEATRQALKNS